MTTLQEAARALIESAIDSDASGRPEGSLYTNAIALRNALASLPTGDAGDCGNAECGWRGPLSECSYVGAVGPCCPKCREIVEPDARGDAGEPVAPYAYEVPTEDGGTGLAYAAWYDKYHREPLPEGAVPLYLATPPRLIRR